MLESKEIIVKSNCNLNEDDLELLTMFFENEKYSHGGTISKVSMIDPFTFTIDFENQIVRKRILEMKTFKFSKYDLKCSSHLHLNNKMFKLSTREIMLRNFDFERSVIELYAEYLSPDNDIVDIKNSKLFEKSFIIVYKEDLSLSDVQTRFNKRSTLKNIKLELVECFKTNSFIIKSEIRLDMEKIRTQLEKLIKSNYFLENFDDTLLIVQFDSEYSSNEENALESMCIEHKLIIEKCYNFDLPDSIKRITKEIERLDKATQTNEEFDFQSYNLIKLEASNYFNLNIEHPLAIGLFNNAQLILNLQEYLKQFNLEISCEKTCNDLSIVFDYSSQVSRDELKNKLNNFYCDEFAFKVFQLPKEKQVEKAISDYISQKSDVYYRFVENKDAREFLCLELYGSKEALNDVHRKFKKITKKLIKPSEQETLKDLIKSERKLKNQKKAKMVYEELKNINDFIVQSSFTPISAFKSEEINVFQWENSILIEDTNRSILKKCLIGCHKIFQDFTKDLKKIDSNLCIVRIETESNEESCINLMVVLESSKTKFELNLLTKVSELIKDYENNRLKEGKFKLADFVLVEEIYIKIIRDLKKLDSLTTKEKLKQSLNFIYIHLIENRLVEFYGYKHAVEIFDEFIKFKHTNYFKSFTYMLTGLLRISVNTLKVPLLEIFYKFNGLYFNDFNEQLKKVNASAIITDDKTIEIICKNNLLNGYKGNLFKILRLYEKSVYRDEGEKENVREKYENILKWNALVKEFLNMYLSNFGVSKIDNMPFTRDDEESKNFSYDQNLLDVNWLSTKSVKILGLKNEVDNLKRKITDLYLKKK